MPPLMLHFVTLSLLSISFQDNSSLEHFRLPYNKFWEFSLRLPKQVKFIGRLLTELQGKLVEEAIRQSNLFRAHHWGLVRDVFRNPITILLPL